MYRAVLSLCLLTSSSLVWAGDWAQFRGPNGGGVANEKNLPSSWSKTENVKWTVETPGRSVSSPIVLGKKLFVTSASGVRYDKLHVLCYDVETGKQLWRRDLQATGNTGHHPKSSMAAPSPCADETGVYCLFATADLVAFDLDGNLKWYRSLAGDYPAIANQVGMASSPVLAGGKLIVPMDTAGDSFLAALDTKDGRNLWKLDRPREINWVTPTIREAQGKTEIVFLGKTGAYAYSAEDGKVIWSVKGEAGAIASPLVFGNEVLLPFRNDLVCVKPANGEAPEVWKSAKLVSSAATPLLYEGKLYSISRAGLLVCADPKTGKEIWSERLKRGTYWASPVAADGKIFAFNDEGTCTIIAAGGEKAEIISTNDIGSELMGTPAIANGSIILRTVNGIYCIAKR